MNSRASHAVVKIAHLEKLRSAGMDRDRTVIPATVVRLRTFPFGDRTVIADGAHARGRRILLLPARRGFGCRMLEPVSVDRWNCDLPDWKQPRQAERVFATVQGNACGRRQAPCRNPAY